MSDDDRIKAIERVVGDLIGIRPSAATGSRLASSVEARAAIRGISPDKYAELLREDPRERQELLELLTVQETSFFRDEAQFLALAEVMAEMDGPLVAWSAGCSTGAEPYSLAMAFDELGLSSWFVVASDISNAAIERTKAGWYTERELRGLSAARKNKYMERDGNGWRVVPELRARVRTVHHNLATEAPPVRKGECSIVFCRNVLIYLRRERIGEFVRRLADWIAPGGYLFLSMSEVLWDFDARFDLLRLSDGAFAYRRVPGSVSGTELRKIFPSTPVPVTPPAPRPRPPAPEPSPRRSPSPSSTSAEAEALKRTGETAAREGRHEEAVADFRKAIYLEPDDPLMHLSLGLELEAAGDQAAANRAFRAALAALKRGERDRIEASLEGYGVDALEELLTAKLAGH